MSGFDLYTAKLEESGLTLEDAKKFGIEYLEAAETASLCRKFKSLPSLKLNYYAPDKKLLVDQPKGSPFFRVRYLKVMRGFAGLGKSPRYAQPPDTLPSVYYPRNLEWGVIASDPSKYLIITEGELKACKACKSGFPTIGLGGVNSWRALKRGVEWLTSLSLIKWVKRPVYICFDSDYTTNPAVCNALKSLSEALEERGARVFLITLPQVEANTKTGLDDFLVNAGLEGVERFQVLLRDAVPLGFSRTLFSLNSQYICITAHATVIERSIMKWHPPAIFKSFVECDLKYCEAVLTPKGEVRHKYVSAASKWLTWSLRSRAADTDYRPGEVEIVQKKIGRKIVTAYNTWTGWGCDPIEGDVSLFLEFVDYLFKTSPVCDKEWFLDWVAYPIKYPGTKLFTCVVIHGATQGVGKSLIGESLKEIYDANYVAIKQTQLDPKHSFNEWLIGKQFVLGNEITGNSQRRVADTLKEMITGSDVLINRKHFSMYSERSCANYFFTSNHPDAFFLEDTDRRFFIHEAPTTPLPLSFYEKYRKWLTKGGGASAIFYYLKNRDLSNFNPHAPALDTLAKENMRAESRSELGSWVRKALAAPEIYLSKLCNGVKCFRDMYSAQELFGFYDPLKEKGKKVQAIGREFKSAGCPTAYGGRSIKTSVSVNRYYIIRNEERWLNATHSEIVDYLERYTPKQNKVNKY